MNNASKSVKIHTLLVAVFLATLWCTPVVGQPSSAQSSNVHHDLLDVATNLNNLSARMSQRLSQAVSRSADLEETQECERMAGEAGSNVASWSDRIGHGLQLRRICAHVSTSEGHNLCRRTLEEFNSSLNLRLLDSSIDLLQSFERAVRANTPAFTRQCNDLSGLLARGVSALQATRGALFVLSN